MGMVGDGIVRVDGGGELWGWMVGEDSGGTCRVSVSAKA